MFEFPFNFSTLFSPGHCAMSRPARSVGNVARSVVQVRARPASAVVTSHGHTRSVSPRTSSGSSRVYSTHPSKPPKQGQPLSATHPHLIHSKHLTAGIPASEYEDRRRRLMESLGEGAKVVCMGNTVRLVTQRESHLCRFLIAFQVY